MLDFSELIWWGLGPKIGLTYSVPALQTSWSMATADKKKLVCTFHVSIIAQGKVKGNLQLCKTAPEGNTN